MTGKTDPRVSPSPPLGAKWKRQDDNDDYDDGEYDDDYDDDC